MTPEHPFARYIRPLAGPQFSRALSEEETFEAFRMIIAEQVEPVQIGSFLSLVRESTETPQEVAGFVRAARSSLALPADRHLVDVDWPAYSGKSRRLPWFLLAALLLARNGIRVLMHGSDEHSEGRMSAAAALASLGIAPAASTGEAIQQLETVNFAYLPLQSLSPRLHDLMALKSVLGVRTPVHSFVRNLNPFKARCLLIGVAHEPYRALHQAAGALLGERHIAVFVGDGGEAERRPETACDVGVVGGDGVPRIETWPALIPRSHRPRECDMRADHLAAVWAGKVDDAVGEAAITGTVAIVLKALSRASDQPRALDFARAMWEGREPLWATEQPARGLASPAA